MELQEHYTDLIQKYISGSIAKEELLSLHEWLKKTHENVIYFNQLCNIYEKGSETTTEDKDTERALLNLNKRIREFETPVNRKGQRFIHLFAVIGKVAAVFAGLLVLGFLLTFYIKNKDSQQFAKGFIVAMAPPSQKCQIVLLDGTKVWLNSGSRLKYAANYGVDTREVYLEGEAFFQVAKNKKKPFLVHAHSIIVKALGTSFNVKCYASDNTVETSLVEGRVQIEKVVPGQHEKKYIVLNPNEKAIFDKKDKVIKVARYEAAPANAKILDKNAVMPEAIESGSIESDVSWKDQYLVFENESFEDLSKRLERWYNINITISNERLKKERFTGKFVNNESLQQVLKIISKTTPIMYSIDDQTVLITPGY